MAGAGDTVRGCREQTKTFLTVAIYLGTCNMPFGLLAAWAGWDYLSRVHTDIWKRAPGRLPSCLPFWPGQAPQFTLPYPRAVSQRCPGESEGRASAQKELRRNDLLCKRDLFQFPFSCERRLGKSEMPRESTWPVRGMSDGAFCPAAISFTQTLPHLLPSQRRPSCPLPAAARARLGEAHGCRRASGSSPLRALENAAPSVKSCFPRPLTPLG